MPSTTYTNGHAFLCIHCMWGRCDLNLFDQHVTKLPSLESVILLVKSLVGGVAGLLRGHPKRHYWHTWVRRCHSLTTLCEREVRSVMLTLLGMLHKNTNIKMDEKAEDKKKSFSQPPLPFLWPKEDLLGAMHRPACCKVAIVLEQGHARTMIRLFCQISWFCSISSQLQTSLSLSSSASCTSL